MSAVNQQPVLSPLATAVKIAIVGLGIANSAVNAATIEVNSILDDGTDCTLRDAIVTIARGSGGRGCIVDGVFGIDDTINVADSVAGDTITLSNNGQLRLFVDLDNPATSEMTINGNGITVDANGQSRVMFVKGLSELTINDMTFTGGYLGENVAAAGGSRGAGILFEEGPSANDDKLTINNSTITNNTSGNSTGGILVSLASLTINDSVISNNTAKNTYDFNNSGIALEGSNYSLTINNSKVSNNSVSGFRTGSAVGTDRGNVIIIKDSDISDNKSYGTNARAVGITLFSDSAYIVNSIISNNQFICCSKDGYGSNIGGGIGLGLGPTIIKNTLISGNTGSNGGGIHIGGVDTEVSIIDSTISANLAQQNPMGPRMDPRTGAGGGIFVDGGSNFVDGGSNINIENSTISGNRAYRTARRGILEVGGGGIYAFDSTQINVMNSTIFGNSVGADGGSYDGGNLVISSRVRVSVSNSIIANSTSRSCFVSDEDFAGGVGSIFSDSSSIIEDGSCDTAARAIDALLLPLADNGCTTMVGVPGNKVCVMTHALASNSPAIDTGVGVTFATDQIGTPRPQGAAPDVGAVEFSLVAPSDPGFTVAAVDAVEGRDINVVFTITLNEPQSVLTGYDFRTEAGTAIDGQDYVGRVGRLLFPAGETVLRRRIQVLEDGVPNEDDETFSLVVTDINNPAATLTTQATIQDINNADSLPQISVNVVKVSENNGPALITIELSKPSTERVLVDFQTVIPRGQVNPATAGVDYIARQGRITFEPGETTQVRRITLIDDAAEEANEVFRFGLSGPRGAEIAPGSELQRVFILNDD